MSILKPQRSEKKIGLGVQGLHQPPYFTNGCSNIL